VLLYISALQFNMARGSVGVLLVLGLLGWSTADVVLPRWFSDNMVLQGAPAPAFLSGMTKVSTCVGGDVQMCQCVGGNQITSMVSAWVHGGGD
jgi:hypothetical protein